MVTTDAKSEEKGLCRDKQQIQQWASDKAGKERRLHGVDDPERELRDVEGQHGNQPGYGSLVSHPEAADGIQPQYTHSNGDCTADVKFGWDKPKRSQEENVSGKVPQFLFLPGEAASKDYVHHPLPAEAEAIHKQATLIVWEAVLISVFVIEEYRNKTICLLFTYPISRTKLITAKLILICCISFTFHVLSNIFQYATIFLAAKCFDFVTFSFGNILAQAVTTISAILLGLLPLYVGMIKKSTIATVVSSIIIVAIASNSQGSSAGLMSIPVAAIIFGIIGIIFSAVAMRKMILSDLSN